MLTSQHDKQRHSLDPTEPFDPFFNTNTTDDLAEAERLAALDGG
jgi:hypothetical protein